MMKVLFDTNVLIDALTERTDDYKYCQKLIKAAIDEKIDGYISSKQITDIYYILRKELREEERRRVIKTIANTFTILPLLASDIKYCVNSNIVDYEDAIIDEVASVNMIKCIVTNNIKDFADSKSIIMTPRDLYTIVSIEQ